MAGTREAPSTSRTVKVRPQELQRLVQGRKDLDQAGLLARHAARYLRLGWKLVALGGPAGAELGIDFGQPPPVWTRRFMDLALLGRGLALALELGPASGLFGLKVRRQAGEAVLERCGAWRAPCVARTGAWELHLFLLPPGWELSSGSLPEALEPQVAVISAGEKVVLPPSFESESRETWRWLSPPWERPPENPPAGLLAFLRGEGLAARTGAGLETDLPSWREVCEAIRPHARVLRALLEPAASARGYYQQILCAALQCGCNDPWILKGLLWHAPHGDLAQRPESLADLEELVAALAELAPEAGKKPIQPPAGEFQAEEPWAGYCTPDSDLGLEEAAPGQDEMARQLDFLTIKAAQLERQLARLQHGENPAAGEASQKINPPEKQEEKSPEVPQEKYWLSLLPPDKREGQALSNLRASVTAFLARHPEFSPDQKGVQLLLYCYRNYIETNPSYSGLTCRERLSRAWEIARGFIKEQVC